MLWAALRFRPTALAAAAVGAGEPCRSAAAHALMVRVAVEGMNHGVEQGFAIEALSGQCFLQVDDLVIRRRRRALPLRYLDDASVLHPHTDVRHGRWVDAVDQMSMGKHKSH